MRRYIRFEIPYEAAVAWKRSGLIPEHWQVLHQEHTINFLVLIPVGTDDSELVH